MHYINNRKGSSLVLIIVLMMLMATIGVGFIALSSFGANSSVVEHNNTQCFYIAKSIEQSICKSIEDDNSSVMDSLLEMALADYEEYNSALESYNRRILEGETGLTKPNKEDYIKPAYISKGETSLENSAIVETHIEYDFISQLVHVYTTASYKGFNCTIKAKMIKTGTSDPPGSIVPGEYDYVLGFTGSGLVSDVTISKNDKNGNLLTDDSIKLDKHNIVGNVISGGSVYIHKYSLVEGDIWAKGNVTIQGILEDGTIYSEGNVNLNPESKELKGIEAKGIVSFSGNGYNFSEPIQSDHSIILVSDSNYDAVYSTGNITSTGSSVTIKSLKANGDIVLNNATCGNIISNGDVTLSNCRINGYVLANGNVTIEDSTSISGSITANGSVRIYDDSNIGKDSDGYSVIARHNISVNDSTLNGGIWGNRDISVIASDIGKSNEGISLMSSISVNYDVSSVSLAGDILCSGLINGVPGAADDVVGPDVASVSVVSPLSFTIPSTDVPEIPFTVPSSAVYKGTLTSKSFNKNLVLDASAGDVYYYISSKPTTITLDGNEISVIGTNRVFLIVEDKNITLKITNTLGNNDGKLFIVSDQASDIELSNGAVLNAQIYLPYGIIDMKNVYEATINGIVTVDQINGKNNQDNNLQINYVMGDYGDTSLEPILGGNDSVGGLPPGAGLKWTVSKYYQ